MAGKFTSLPVLTEDEEIALARRIEAGVFAEHLLVTGCPDYATTPELWAVRADGKAAWSDFFHGNLRLAAYVANRWGLRFNLDTEDIMQECCLALGMAIMAWDWTRGTRFSTLAFPRLRYTAELACWGNCNAGQSPATWMRQRSRRRRGWTPPRVLTETDDVPLAEDTPVRVGHISHAQHVDDLEFVKGRLALLNDRDRVIIERRFGLGNPTASYTQLAKDLCTSARTIKRLEERALATMAREEMPMAA